MSTEHRSWYISLHRKMGNLYMEWNTDICFTKSKIRRLHRHFSHPSHSKLIALIERAKPEEATSKTRSTIAKIRRADRTCQRNSKEPSRFRVSMPPEDCILNHTVALDLMKIAGSTILHCVDHDTKFSAAAFTTRETSRSIWQTFLDIWVTTYIGYPDVLAVDQGTQFVSEEFTALCVANGIQVNSSGIESHNAMGGGESYHSYLRQI